VVIKDSQLNPVASLTPPLDPHPYQHKLPLGAYLFEGQIVSPQPQLKNFGQLIRIEPAYEVKNVKVRVGL
jgi:hypothetical protein